MNTNTKYWSFTWDTNILQKKIPSKMELLQFLNQETDYSVFQFEIGSEKKKKHIQGSLVLLGGRSSKQGVLKLFSARFKNISGLTLNPVYDKIALAAYVTKEEGRIEGPFYGGKSEMFNADYAQNTLKNWQLDLYSLISGPDLQDLKNRKVIWVEDCRGNTGKSWFQKWLRIGQKTLVSRALPVSTVDRLMSAVNLITKKEKVDLFTIDLTRSIGKDQSYADLFCAIEQIKNGYVVDVMYGKYNEAIFEPPLIIIFTNGKLEDFKQYLSEDRWFPFLIGLDKELYNISIESGSPTYSRVKEEEKKVKKV